MELQTKVELSGAEIRIGHGTQVMMIGSCFVENIGARMEYFGFDPDINPCGIVYNPLSVARTLELLMDNRPFVREDLREHGGTWLSLLHHGRFSDADPERCLDNINARLKLSAANLRQTDLLIITFGTAWVYRCRENGQIVSNCHKIPEREFERFRLTPEEIVAAYDGVIGRLREINPGIRILFTVSPVRHWKDGAHGNQLSKSVLLLAVDMLMQRWNGTGYFPAYEIVMDELRDYRYYAEDMLHVSSQAVEYIWERFRDTHVDKAAVPLMNRIDRMNRTLMHRPSDPGSEASVRLQQQMAQEKEEIDALLKSLRQK